MARELPVISPGNVITYTLGHMTYTSVVIRITEIDHNGYLTVELYDLTTPDNVSFPCATIDDPVELSLNASIADLHIYDYDEYAYEHPELFI